MKSIALFAAAALLGACTETPTDAPVEPAQKTGQPAKAGEPAAAKMSLAAKVLSNSLNRTVRDRARFEKAPLYELSLDVDFDLFTYTGTQKVTLRNQESDPLTELHFMVHPNTEALNAKGTRNLIVSGVKVDGAEAEVLGNTATLRVGLPKPLPPGEQVVVELAFKGIIYRLPDQASDMKKLAVEQLMQMVTGAGPQNPAYGVFSVGDGIVSLAQWHPLLAAYDEHGWDIDPGTGIGDSSYYDVSNFSVNVTTPKDVVVAATGVEVDRKTQGERTTTTFHAGAVREFSVQMSAHYAKASRMVDGVNVSSYFLEADRSAGEQVLDQAVQAVRIFNRRFGDYPYAELDLAEAPLVGGAGGVEFPGLVTIAKMFYGDAPNLGAALPAMGNSGNRYLRETREFVVAHEVAHQWWNAVVGSDSKRHPFVDEALANHSAVLYFEDAHGKEAADRQRALQLKMNYQVARMAGAQDRPLDLPAKAFDGMLEYASVVYAKGGLFFDALRDAVGDAAHREALRRYYREHRFGIARPDALVDAFAAGAQDPQAVKRLAQRWMKGAHADQDIGKMDVIPVLMHLVGEEALQGMDPQLLRVLKHRGAGEIKKLVEAVIAPDGSPQPNVDFGAVLEMAGEFLSAEDAELARMFQTVGRLLSHLDGDTPPKPRALMREMGTLLGEDEREARLLLEAAGLVLEALDDPPQRAPRHAPHPRRRRP